jgi:hypothetical protein
VSTKIRYFQATAYAPSLAHDPLDSDAIVRVSSSEEQSSGENSMT